MKPDLLGELNIPQQQAVQAVEGPVLVLAGPGSGKTRVLTHRIAYLIHEVGVDPFHIMAVTFTNKAAREMRERLNELIGPGPALSLTVGTFHSICARILRRDIDRLGRERDFAVYDSDDQERLMRRVLRDLSLDEKQFAPRAVHSRISSAKNELVGPAEYARLNRAYYDTVVARCYERYQALLRENNALDFDDLLVETVRLFEEHPDVLERYQDRYVFLLVDEYQDTNRAQYMFVKQLAAKRRNLFVVGDEDQCLPQGTLVRTPDGERAIEQIGDGDQVMAGGGQGAVTVARVLRSRARPFTGKLIRITLADGRVCQATANHIFFARPAVSEEIYYVCLLHDEKRGYRFAIASGAELAGEVAPTLSGVQVRSNQAPAERVWILQACTRLDEAEQIVQGYCAIYSLQADAEQLIDALGLYAGYPHYRAEGLDNAERGRPQRGGHGAIEGNGLFCEEAGRWAILSSGDRFAFQPAAHLRPTMIVPVWQDGRIGEATIEAIERIDYDGTVYDLDIERLHNYTAQGLVVHNSVYGWRGADIRNIRSFESDYPEARVFLLEQNYRSTQAILDVASAVIKGGGKRKHEKKLWTTNAGGLQVELHEGYDQNEETLWVAEEINRLVAAGDYRYGDCAVMYRTNAQSRALEEALVARGVRYQIVGGTRFYERKEIKDVLAYLRLAYNPFDSVSLGRVLNVPGRGIGERTEGELSRWAAQLGVPVFQALRELGMEGSALVRQTPAPFNSRTRNSLLSFHRLVEDLIEARIQLDLPALFDRIVERLAFRDYLLREYGAEEGDDRWANVVELRNVTEEYINLPLEAQLPTFLEEVALVSDIDALDRESDVATCITLHQAKGLEYPIVFLIGLEEGLMPHSRSTDDRDKLEEERRLLYVGATRARERLYLLYAFRRTSYGRTNLVTPSRFLADIPQELLKRAQRRKTVGTPQTSMFTRGGKPGGSPRRETVTRSGEELQGAAPEELTFFPGQRVRHATFGEGLVVSSKLVEGDEEVTVNFGNRERRLLASFARLERLQE